MCHFGAWTPEPPLVTLLGLGCKLLILYSKWDHPFPKAREGLAITLSFCISSLLASALSALRAPGGQAGLRVCHRVRGRVTSSASLLPIHLVAPRTPQARRQGDACSGSGVWETAHGHLFFRCHRSHE